MTEPPLAFTTDIAARLTGLSQRQVRRLDADGIVRPSMVRGRYPHPAVYSFNDLVPLRAMARLRRRGVSRRDLRQAAESLGDRSSEMIRREGVEASLDALDLASIRADLRRRVDRLKARTGTRVGRVVSDRLIHGGEPVFAGTRIRVATIQTRVRAGDSDAEILRDYPGSSRLISRLRDKGWRLHPLPWRANEPSPDAIVDPVHHRRRLASSQAYTVAGSSWLRGLQP